MRFYLVTALIWISITSNAQYLPGSVLAGQKYSPKMPEVIWQRQNCQLGVNNPAIDSCAIKHWVNLDNSKLSISNDGQYFSYGMSDRPFKTTRLVVQSVSNSWKVILEGITDGFFSEDNREFIYLDGSKLQFLTLGSDAKRTIANISSCQLPKSVKRTWLIYQLQNSEHELIICHLPSKKEFRYANVASYQFNEEFESLILVRNNVQLGQLIISMEWVKFRDDDLEKKKENANRMWRSQKGMQLMSYVIDGSLNQCSFLVVDSLFSPTKPKYSVWYYRLGMDTALKIIDDSISKSKIGLELNQSSVTSFTSDGRYLILKLKEPELSKAPKGYIGLDVWNYKDKTLQSSQLLKIKEGQSLRSFTAVVNIEKVLAAGPTPEIVRLEKEGEQLLLNLQEIGGNYCISYSPIDSDRFWENIYSFWLVSMVDGSRKLLYKSKNKNGNIWISPTGKYMISSDDNNQYWSWDLKTGKRQSLSEKIPFCLPIPPVFYRDFHPRSRPAIAGWIKVSEHVLIYDQYDLWEVDLSCKNPAINLTQEFGRKNKIFISLAEKKKIFSVGDDLVFSLFNPQNKYNGLSLVKLGSADSIVSPTLGPWTLYYETNLIPGGNTFKGLMRPLKAGRANTWIVSRQSATEAPNYFITHDFKEYKNLTNLNPQRSFNWISAELLEWKLPDSTIGQGILYKPENFDPQKKYPVIIYYYEKMSSRLHQFPIPEFTRSTHINIAWFVSHGYLVFTPDMYYKNGHMVESVCNTVISAGQSLALLPFVDRTKMGISGFSWGGIQTNWLITQTDLFTAAATGGAIADPISTALQVWGSRGEKTDNGMEGIENRLGYSLWERSEVWLKTAPMLRADKVTMAVLMMNNYGDKLWQQSVELFTAMRRLDKKVWMLQYDHGDHGVYGPGGHDAEDFTIRISQYFDHYLKSAPAPVWMSRGIPANLKGIETGYALDPLGSCGKDCNVCKTWNEKWARDSVATKQLIEKEEKNQWMGLLDKVK